MDIPSLAVGSLFGILAGVVGTWITNQSRLYQRNAELQHSVLHLQKLNTAFEEEVADFKKREADRTAQEYHQREHCRDEKQVAILKILDPHVDTRLCDIAKQFELSEKAIKFHLQSLSADGFVKSSNYLDNPELGTISYDPSKSTWIIQQLGLAYLAKNDELA